MAKTVLDPTQQVMRCLGCGEEHPLKDGINNRPVWFTAGVMKGFADHHSACEISESLTCKDGMRPDMKILAQSISNADKERDKQ